MTKYGCPSSLTLKLCRELWDKLVLTRSVCYSIYIDDDVNNACYRCEAGLHVVDGGRGDIAIWRWYTVVRRVAYRW